ncbi:MAG TPA: hypothetical protein VKR42_12535 [Ktedonobacteraceae bacterium]|nr:hypothetical protein [Ktedonobacteraceae bacterium]
MGQYQQWLHYRDVDRLLRTQLEELAEEFAQLRNREQLLQHMLHPVHAQEQPALTSGFALLQSNNEILHALAVGLNGHTDHLQHTDYTPATSENGTTEMLSHQSEEQTPLQSNQDDTPVAAISQALFAQSSLPSTEEQFPLVFSQPLSNQHVDLPLIPHTPHSESLLLPEDIGAFIDQHTQTEPRMELPWWLRNAALQNANGPIDQESIRTNRLIQRWIERWGRYPDARELPEGSQESRNNGENGGMGLHRENQEEKSS